MCWNMRISNYDRKCLINIVKKVNIWEDYFVLEENESFKVSYFLSWLQE